MFLNPPNVIGGMLALKKNPPEKTKPMGSNSPPPRLSPLSGLMSLIRKSTILYPIFADGSGLKLYLKNIIKSGSFWDGLP